MAFENKNKNASVNGNNHCSCSHPDKDVQKRYQQDFNRYQAQIEKTRKLIDRPKAA